jgi:SOS-response transcriptional repressor LexA
VATGLGKTWLAAFDAQAVGRELGRCPRVIVIAHRAEILAQAESVFRRAIDSLWPKTATSWCLGREASFEGPLVIASIQKLARPEVCEQLSGVVFDYAIIDEVHHAHAASYRRVLSKLQASFALGLTATPERSDGVDVAALFDDVLAWHASIGDGIQEEALVPFSYIGLRDDVDYRQIPWRQGKFDPGVLEVMLENSRRMESLWRAWTNHPGGRTLVFCSSQRHALYTRDWLRRQGIRAAAVFAAPNSDSRSESLEQLERGDLDAVCAVDLFNEGVDLPTVDRVVMLRPTESRVLFLQQLGRGLRAAPGKSRLIVIDFVGNHRVFARRLIHLLSLHNVDAGWIELRRWLDRDEASLPPGCLLEVAVEARDVLRSFIPGGTGAAVEAYRGMRDEQGRRPTMAELFHRGYLPATIRAAHDQWFRFVEQEGDLDDAERGVLATAMDWFRMLETTALNRSFKMVVIEVLLDRGALWTGLSVSDLGVACRQRLLGHPELCRDLEPNAQIPDHRLADPAVWNAWWRTWPVQKWTEPQAGRTWFSLDEEQFAFLGKCEVSLRPTFEAMTTEVVEYRLAQYLRRSRAPAAAGFTAKVSHSGGHPILFLPDGGEWEGRPFAWTAVTLPNGANWKFNFVKVACNVARPVGAKDNQLATLLRTWFGPNSGLPGTNFQVRFEPTSAGFAATPVGVSTAIAAGVPVEAGKAEIVEFPPLILEPPEQEKYVSFAPVYTLEAAAGLWGPDHAPVAQGWMRVEKPKLSEGMFVGRVVGDSMEPRIPSGSWCLFRRGRPVGSRNGRILLVQFSSLIDPEHGGKFTVKQYHSEKQQTEDGWRHEHIELRSLNPAFTPIHVTEGEAENLRIVGEFLAVVRPG